MAGRMSAAAMLCLYICICSLLVHMSVCLCLGVYGHFGPFSVEVSSVWSNVCMSEVSKAASSVLLNIWLVVDTCQEI